MRKLLAIMALATLAILLFWYDRELRNRVEDIRQQDNENGVNPGLDLSEFDDE